MTDPLDVAMCAAHCETDALFFGMVTDEPLEIIGAARRILLAEADRGPLLDGSPREDVNLGLHRLNAELARRLGNDA